MAIEQIIYMLTSGLYGGLTRPASSILKLISLKKGCDCTSLPPELWQPNLRLGFLESSYSSRKQSSSSNKKMSYLRTNSFVCFGTHPWTQVSHVWGKCFSILLHLFPDPSLHLRGFGMLPSTPERWLPCRHFINEAAEAPPVHSQPVKLVADHLRSYILFEINSQWWLCDHTI